MLMHALHQQKVIGDNRVSLTIVDDYFPQALKTKLPSIRVIRNHKNMGFPATCNVGAKAGGAPYIAFLNSDMIPEPGWIEVILQKFDSYEEIGVIGGLLAFPPDSPDPSRPAGRVQHAGIMFDTNQNAIHRLIGWGCENPRVQIELAVQAVTGAFLVTRRNLYNKLGGFFEGYGRGTWEDVDYCIRAIRHANSVVLYTPELRGIHYVGGSNSHFPLNENKRLFQQRLGKDVAWDEWDFP